MDMDSDDTVRACGRATQVGRTVHDETMETKGGGTGDHKQKSSGWYYMWPSKRRRVGWGSTVWVFARQTKGETGEEV